MSSRGGWSKKGSLQPPLTTTTRSWGAANSQSNDASPEWLRRSYTRTIPKHLRTVEQLRLSFEDARQQWRDLCSTFSSHEAIRATPAPLRAASSTLPPGVRHAVDRIVSQLKAVKQELLAQLTQLLKALSTSAVAFDTSTEVSQDAKAAESHAFWLADLLTSCNDNRTPQSAASGQVAVAARQDYLTALWLARRVWVWSICLACATMDLELLSGSVSLSTQLFFGCPFLPAEGVDKIPQALKKCSLPSCYDMEGAFTEKDLLTAARSHAESRNQAIGANALPNEACEVRAFFGSSISSQEVSKQNTTSQTTVVNHSSYADPVAAMEEGDEKHAEAVAYERARCGAASDSFWVHAAALCYSTIAREDVSAARLLGAFATAHQFFLKFADGDGNASPSTHERPLAAAPENDSATLTQCTFFVLRIAKLLVDEDYVALRTLWQQMGYLDPAQPFSATLNDTNSDNRNNTAGSSDVEAVTHATPFAASCPEAWLIVLLLRLLSEHVVRRRWTEAQVGQAFRPIEPVTREQTDRKENKEGNQNRLACALSALFCDAATASAEVSADERGVEGACSIKTGAVWLSQFLQIAALHDMGGDWPLPGPLLKAAFGTV